MDEKIVDAVAQAMHVFMLRNIPASQIVPWDEVSEPTREVFRIEARVAVEAYEAELEKKGLVIVPKEPTEKMDEAGSAVGYECVIFSPEPGEGIDSFDMRPAYRAMIAARPGQH